MSTADEIQSLVEIFVDDLQTILRRDLQGRLRLILDDSSSLSQAFATMPTLALAPRLPPAVPIPEGYTATGRKKPPKQLCPVPGCPRAAAPKLGMVCSDHVNVKKTEIKRYREERKRLKEEDRAALPLR